MKVFEEKPEKKRTGYRAVNVLLAWAHTNFTNTEGDAEKSSLNEHWSAALGEIESVHKLKRDFEALAERVADALAFLNGPALPEVCYRDAARVQTALETLDDVSMLSVAMEFSPYAKDIRNEVSRALDNLLIRTTVEEAPSGLRLCPLNRWRRKKLNGIPPARQFLFPWYELWSKLPEDTLDRLIAAWSDLEGGSGRVEGIDEGDLAAIFGELERDGGLLDWIRKKAGVGCESGIS